MKPAAERFKVGDIVRYGSGVSALFRYEGHVNAGRLYGTHVLGGAIGASDQTFFDLQPASAEDVEFCKSKRPDWFPVSHDVSHEIAMPNPNPWHPMTTPIDLKHLGKLGEECNELGASVSRCIIQGIGENEPVTGKPNREWLEDEIADVTANIALVTEHFSLDNARIFRRVVRKMEHLRKWHGQLTAYHRPEDRK